MGTWVRDHAEFKHAVMAPHKDGKMCLFGSWKAGKTYTELEIKDHIVLYPCCH